MNFKLFRRSIGAKMIGLATLVAALSSCSGNGDVAGVIPADVKFAMRFDFKQMIENSGCSINDGKIELSPELKAALADNPQALAGVQLVLGYTEGFDLADLAFFMRSDNEPIAVITLTDEKKVTDNIAQFLGQPDNRDGFKTFSPGGGATIAIKDNRLWVSSGIDEINDAIKAAERKHIGTMPGIDQFLNADNAFSFVISAKAIDLPSNFNDQWICASTRFAGSEMSGELCMMDADGKRYPFGDAFGEVSTDFLRYVPADMTIVGALGEVKEPALKNVIASYARQAGEYGKYLTGIDGTLAGAVDMTDAMPTTTSDMINGNFDIDKIKFIVMAHYPQALADSLVTDLNDNLMLGGQYPVTEKEGIYNFTVDNMEFYFGNIDGYATLANYIPVADAQNELADKFTGRRGVLYSKSTPNGMFGIDYSSEGTMWLESDAIKYRGRLIGTDKKFLQAVVDVLLNPDFRDMVMAAVNQAYAEKVYDYDYDYDSYPYDFTDDSED